VEISKTREVKKAFRKIWPVKKLGIGFIWSVDKHYHVPRLEDVKKFLKESKLNEEKPISGSKECDYFAFMLHAESKKYFLSTKDNLKHPVSFGHCFCDQWEGIPLDHNANICFTTTGVYLIEPMTDEFRKGNSRSDNVRIIGL